MAPALAVQPGYSALGHQDGNLQLTIIRNRRIKIKSTPSACPWRNFSPINILYFIQYAIPSTAQLIGPILEPTNTTNIILGMRSRSRIKLTFRDDVSNECCRHMHRSEYWLVPSGGKSASTVEPTSNDTFQSCC